jgi:hypothetical protein
VRIITLRYTVSAERRIFGVLKKVVHILTISDAKHNYVGHVTEEEREGQIVADVPSRLSPTPT